MKFKTNVIHKGVFYSAGTDVPVEYSVNVELTDNVPDDSLEENPDGTVNIYNVDNEVVGTVDKEELEQIMEQAGTVIVESAELAENELSEPVQRKKPGRPKKA